MLFRVLVASVVMLIFSNPAHANITFVTSASGAEERPTPVNTPGIASVSALHDQSFGTLAFEATFSGLTSSVTGAHIHCCATSTDANAGIAIDLEKLGFPIGVTSGSSVRTIQLNESSTYEFDFLAENSGDPIEAHGQLASAMKGTRLGVGVAYLHIHTTMHPEGELRGNFAPFTDVPEPSTLLLLVCSAAGLYTTRRFR